MAGAVPIVMSHREDRREFAQARPLPPFGAIVKRVVHILQLRDPESYKPDSNGQAAQRALEVLDNRTSDNTFAGLIVKADTKERVCEALATCLRALPSMPFDSVPLPRLKDAIQACWKSYEQVASRLTAFPEAREPITRALFRHATVEIAIRAGAIACLCGDNDLSEDTPIWSKHKELKKYLRDLIRPLGSRDKAKDQLRRSRNELDRWLDELDVPAPSDINRWENLLISVSGHSHARLSTRPLWRLYVGRRVWNSVASEIPADLHDELLRAYCRIKRGVCAYLRLERRGTEADRRRQLVFLAVTGRIVDPLLRAQLVGGETDRLWARHIEAACQIENSPTVDIIGLCETYANAASAFEEGAAAFGMRLPMKLDDFVRAYLLKVEEGGNPLAEIVKHDNAGDYEKAASSIEKLLETQPTSATSWHSLGRLRVRQEHYDNAETCYRKALEFNPQSSDVRGDLAILLAGLGRGDEAIAELAQCTDEQKCQKEWTFAHAIALLCAGRAEEAREEFLKCVTARFKLGPCYRGLAEACEKLGDLKGALEYKKRMDELHAGPPHKTGRTGS